MGKTANVASFDEIPERSCASTKKSAFIYLSLKALVPCPCNEIGKVWILFYERLVQIDSNHILEAMLDDFNINALEQNSVILQVLASYAQVISES